jgi:hypothetical protein
MMSARAYAIRLALLIVVFVVVIPGAVVGLLAALNASPEGRNAGLGFAYAAFFLGIPLWILSFAIACWWTASARARAVGFPFWVALSLFVLVAADWRFVFWMFGHTSWFLYGAAALLVSLLFLPDRGPSRETSQSPGLGFRIATGAVAVEALLACLVLAGSLIWSFTFFAPAMVVDRYAGRAASWWIFVLCGTMIWAIVESRWRRNGT